MGVSALAPASFAHDQTMGHFTLPSFTKGSVDLPVAEILWGRWLQGHWLWGAGKEQRSLPEWYFSKSAHSIPRTTDQQWTYHCSDPELKKQNGKRQTWYFWARNLDPTTFSPVSTTPLTLSSSPALSLYVPPSLLRVLNFQIRDYVWTSVGPQMPEIVSIIMREFTDVYNTFSGRGSLTFFLLSK